MDVQCIKKYNRFFITKYFNFINVAKNAYKFKIHTSFNITIYIITFL